jgi:hypothetical protein
MYCYVDTETQSARTFVILLTSGCRHRTSHNEYVTCHHGWRLVTEMVLHLLTVQMQKEVVSTALNLYSALYFKQVWQLPYLVPNNDFHRPKNPNAPTGTELQNAVPVKGHVIRTFLSHVKQYHCHVDNACGKFDRNPGGVDPNSFDSKYIVLTVWISIDADFVKAGCSSGGYVLRLWFVCAHTRTLRSCNSLYTLSQKSEYSYCRALLSAYWNKYSLLI